MMRKDDLDAYLIRFERACAVFEIRTEFWSTQLARLLQGRSLDVYQRLPAEKVDNYESLKNQLLQRFRLTEGGYRKKFKMSKLEVGETPEQFVERLNRYLVKWCEMARYDNDYDILLQTFLKEKGKLSLKEMAKAANDFHEAHGCPSDSHEPSKRPNGNMKQPTMNTVNHRNTATFRYARRNTTGSYELCMLIDGIVKRYPTVMVELNTPYFNGKTKVLCMDNPVQDIIIGNIPGASGVHPNLVNTKATVTPNKGNSTQSLHTGILKANRELSKAVPEAVMNSEICLDTNTSTIDAETTTDMCAAVQIRAVDAKESKPPKPLKVKA